MTQDSVALHPSGRSDFRDVVVQVVEADDSLRQSLIAALAERGYECQAFGSVAAYSASASPTRPTCVVVDSSLPGLDGFKLHERSGDATLSIPLVLIAGQGGIPAEARFIERGTTSTLQKPFGPNDLAAAVDRSLRLDEARRRVRDRFSTIEASVEQLSPREKKVLNAIISGQLNKAIARSLDVSVRTVEGDRAKIVEKFQAETTGEVVGKFAQYTLLTEIGYPEFGTSALAI